MWSFEGDYKQKPKQSLGGASRTLNRTALLSKLRSEREEREVRKFFIILLMTTPLKYV